MYKPLTLIVLLLTSSFTVLDVSSIDVSIEETGEETPRPMAINYIPFKEVATIVIDEKDDKMMISYSLLSKDKEDFKIPDSLEAKILGIEKIVSIVYTSEENCALGVLNAIYNLHLLLYFLEWNIDQNTGSIEYTHSAALFTCINN